MYSIYSEGIETIEHVKWETWKIKNNQISSNENYMSNIKIYAGQD